MAESRHPGKRPVEPHPSGIGLSDVYYTLFRHKWKIMAFSAAAVLASLVLIIINPPVYKSDAKLLIKYVQEAKSPTGHAPAGGDSQILAPDVRGESIVKHGNGDFEQPRFGPASGDQHWPGQAGGQDCWQQ